MIPRLLLTLLFLFSLSASAQRVDYRNATLSTPVSAKVKSQTLQTTQGCKTEFEKVYAIHNWITHNVAYSYAYGGYKYTGPDQVITAKKAVCQGYADLFAAMCIAANVEARVVSGFAKTETADINPKDREGNHAWNIVKIDGREYHVDACWDAGNYDAAKAKFIFDPGTEYLLPSPAVFALNHFPENADDQLLDNKVGANEFFSRPLVYSSLLETGYRLMSQLPGVLKPGATVEIRLLQEAACNLSICFGEVNLLEGKNDRFEVIRSGQYAVLKIKVPTNYKGDAILYAQAPGEIMYSGLMAFEVK